MPEIGPTLREARMRARIDISEVEAETKIRAKYLRALENEEWDLLPGPTFVKSFLRTYADALELDSRALVEEYKLRHERLSDVELQPITPRGTERRQPRRFDGLGVPRVYLAWALVLGLLAAVYGVTQLSGNSSDKDKGKQSPLTVVSTPATSSAVTPPPTTPHHSQTTTTKEKPKATVVSLQLIPLGAVSVCLKAAGGRTLLKDVTLQPGATNPTYHSSEFQIALGNNQVDMRINGHIRHVPAVADGISYVIRPSGRHTLPTRQGPTCS